MKNKVMLITWKWDHLGGKGRKIEDEVGVVKSKNKIIRINQENSNKAIQRIVKAVRNKAKDSDFLIFLHRSQLYNESSIDTILHQLLHEKNPIPGSVKCFLFSKGRDYIYHNTQDGGLLADSSGFMNGGRIVSKEFINKKGETKIKSSRPTVVRKNPKTGEEKVLLKDFKLVWNYYEHEFKRKIYELRQSLFIFLTSLPKEKKTRNLLKFIEKSDKFLVARILSFCERLEDESLFEKEEGKTGKSYIFDDCTKNIQEVYEKDVQDNYLTLKNYFIENIIDTKKTTEISNFAKALQEKFDNLLNAMPETIY